MEHGCPRELTQQSAFSPGPVEDREAILYALLEPRLFHHGQVTNEAFAKSKLRAGSLSVARRTYSSPAELQRSVIDP
jgi:hypothetical protein